MTLMSVTFAGKNIASATKRKSPEFSSVILDIVPLPEECTRLRQRSRALKLRQSGFVSKECETVHGYIRIRTYRGTLLSRQDI